MSWKSARPVRRVLAPVIVLAMSQLVEVRALAETFDEISSWRGDNTTVYRIDRPNVTRSATSYPSIVFSPGDRVTIHAGGCVQTGGSGKTWKRYLDPRGDSSRRFPSP